MILTPLLQFQFLTSRARLVYVLLTTEQLTVVEQFSLNLQLVVMNVKVNATVILKGNVVIGRYHHLRGGAMYIEQTLLRVEQAKVNFSNNFILGEGYGGALFQTESNVNISDHAKVTFINSSAEPRGGAIHSTSSDISVDTHSLCQVKCPLRIIMHMKEWAHISMEPALQALTACTLIATILYQILPTVFHQAECHHLLSECVFVIPMENPSVLNFQVYF